MKTTMLLHAVIFTLLNIQFKIVPPMQLLGVLGVAMILDLITGVAKAVYYNEARTSHGYRKTVKKLLQYLGSICVVMILRYMMLVQPELMSGVKYINWIGNGLVAFIILIECTSILENIYAVDKTSVFSKLFIRPLFLLLTVQLKEFFQKDKSSI